MIFLDFGYNNLQIVEFHAARPGNFRDNLAGHKKPEKLSKKSRIKKEDKKMKSKKLGWMISGVMILALVISVGCKKPKEQPAPEPTEETQAQPAKAPAEQPATAPAPETAPAVSTAPMKIGDPARFIFYKADQPTAGKEYQTLDMKVGEEITISVQALDSNGIDTSACPVKWEADSALLKITSIEGNCKASKVKALKSSGAVTLSVVYKGAKGNDIKADLKGSIK